MPAPKMREQPGWDEDGRLAFVRFALSFGKPMEDAVLQMTQERPSVLFMEADPIALARVPV
jgi:hypothetical protein